MEELSLVLKDPHEGEFLQKIEWNKDEVAAMVEDVVKTYAGAVYTEEQMAFAKSDRAKLNAMKKAFSDRRIEVKNAVMAPYLIFENEVKEVVALIEKPIAMIDEQINEYENRVKAEKLQAIKRFYGEVAADLDGVLEFDRIYDERYLNKSFSLSKVKKEIQQKVDTFRTDMKTIEGVCDERFVVSVKSVYMETLDISKALAEESKLKEIDRRMEEERERKEAEAARKQQENVIKQEKNVTKQPDIDTKQPENVVKEAEQVTKQRMPEPANDGTTKEEPEEAASEKKFKASFTVYGTREQIMNLKQYMLDNGIEFGK